MLIDAVPMIQFLFLSLSLFRDHDKRKPEPIHSVPMVVSLRVLLRHTEFLDFC
jgi:hypothetical protein